MGRPVSGCSTRTQTVVSLWLPHWPLTVRAKLADAPPDDLPFAFVEAGPHGIVLTAVNAAARARGLHTGQRHADARAIEPRLVTETAQPARDAAALDALAHWCLRWSPSVAVDPPDGVLIDATGATHLWGGDAGLLADMQTRLKRAATPVRLGLAPTPGAAWAAARHSGCPETRLTDPLRDALAAYPIEALRIDAATRRAAHGLGLKRVGDLYAMPRAGLARRFPADQGLSLVTRLDQLLGIAPEALVTIAPPQRHTARTTFAEPRTDTTGVAAEVPQLIADLAAQLTRAGAGALGLSLTGWRVDGTTTTIHVGLGTASRDPRLWTRLLDTHGLDRLDLGFGIDALGLAATATAPVAEVDTELGGDDTAHEALPELIDRLAARLGGGAVRTARGAARWLPEHAERWVPAQGRALDAAWPADPAGVTRPLILLDPPEPVEATALVPHGAPVQFRWRRVVRRVARVEGPERLCAEWWRGAARTRDYYRVEDEGGARWWLYREGDYGGDPPAWWLHGMFA